MNNNLMLFDRFFNNLPSIFNEGKKDFFSTFPDDYSKILNGKCDFEELSDKYIVELEVPGIKKEEINLNLKNDILTITWNRKKEKKSEIGKSRYERQEGSFTRSFEVDGADFNKIEAELKNGILKITVPKLENFKPKTIEIK